MDWIVYIRGVIMAPKTTEFIINILISTPDGNQEPKGFMTRTHYQKTQK